MNTLARALDYVIVFAASLIATLILTPLVRNLARRIGMVDKPDPRRINKVPIPRGGGIAIVIGVLATYLTFHFVSGRPAMQGISNVMFYKMVVLSVVVALIGLADDRFSLSPRVKLLGQVIVAFLVWLWAGLGFSPLVPSVPIWLDCPLTIFWLVGAMNAFNLIDGLDGLATGLAFIGTLGMAGALFLVQSPQSTLFYFALMGGLLGFLRYNYNPASVFLGDSGSMYLGFTIALLPLASHAHDSFLVSVGVPVLAMGVPIFDTSLAIFRRTLRRFLREGNAGEVMNADKDHLHHRLLRATGLNQRKTALIMYLMAAFAVVVGLVGMYLKDRAAGLWLAALAIGAIIIFKDMSSVELYDAGLLLNKMATRDDCKSRRRIVRIAVPFQIGYDVLALGFVYVIMLVMANIPLTARIAKNCFMIRLVFVLVSLAFFRVYSTIWSRALMSNFVRLGVACLLGNVFATVAIYYCGFYSATHLIALSLAFAAASSLALIAGRIFRPFVRDMFYSFDHARLVNDPKASRVLVYGSGLRYRAFRRELVRSTSQNARAIVGIIDDDLTLRGRYIGGQKVLGTLNDAPEIIREVRADTVVVACQVTDEWKTIIRETLAPTGVKVRIFRCEEQDL